MSLKEPNVAKTVKPFINRAMSSLLGAAIYRRVYDGRIYLASGVTETDIKLMNEDWKLIGGKQPT